MTLVEAASQLGGRFRSALQPSQLDACALQTINGSVNNMFALAMHQCDVTTRAVQPNCRLLTLNGSNVSSGSEAKMDFYFESVLQSVVEWKKTAASDDDVSLQGLPQRCICTQLKE